MAAEGVELSSPEEMVTLLRESALFDEKRLNDETIAAMENAASLCDDDYYSVFWNVFEQIGANK